MHCLICNSNFQLKNSIIREYFLNDGTEQIISGSYQKEIDDDHRSYESFKLDIKLLFDETEIDDGWDPHDSCKNCGVSLFLAEGIYQAFICSKEQIPLKLVQNKNGIVLSVLKYRIEHHALPVLSPELRKKIFHSLRI